MKRKRTYNIRLIKSTLCYSTREIATLFNIHKRTVQDWYMQGLPKFRAGREYVVRGSDLATFLQSKQAKRKRPCKANEFYCCKCRRPQNVHENTVTVTIANTKQATLKGKCNKCEQIIYRFVSTSSINTITDLFTVIKIENRHLMASSPAIVNTDINMET